MEPSTTPQEPSFCGSLLQDVFVAYATVAATIWSALDPISQQQLYAVNCPIRRQCTPLITQLVVELPDEYRVEHMGTFPFLPVDAMSLLPKRGLRLVIRGEVKKLQGYQWSSVELTGFMTGASARHGGNILSLVEHVTFRMVELDATSCQAIADCWFKAGCVRTLEVKDCSVASRHFFNIPGMRSITSLKVSGCAAILKAPGGGRQIHYGPHLHLDIRGEWPKLTTLELGSSSMDGDEVIEVAEAAPNLRVLRAPNCSMLDYAVEMLFTHLSELRELHVGGLYPMDQNGVLQELGWPEGWDSVTIRETNSLALPSLPPLGPPLDLTCLSPRLTEDTLIFNITSRSTPPEAVAAAVEALRAVPLEEIGFVLTFGNERPGELEQLLRKFSVLSPKVSALGFKGFAWEDYLPEVGDIFGQSIRTLKLDFRPNCVTEDTDPSWTDGLNPRLYDLGQENAAIARAFPVVEELILNVMEPLGGPEDFDEFMKTNPAGAHKKLRKLVVTSYPLGEVAYVEVETREVFKGMQASWGAVMDPGVLLEVKL